MIIRPYSDPALHGTGGSCEATAKNFPSLKHFWKCGQSDIGTTKLTDAMGIAHLSSATAIQTPAAPDGFSVFPSVANGSPVTGTLYAPGTHNCIFLAVGQFSTAGLIYGGMGAVGGISLTAAQTASVYDGTNTLNNSVNGAFTSSSSIYGRALAIDWSTGVTSFEATTTSTITTKTQTAIGLLSGGVAAVNASWNCSSTITNLYGGCFIAFAGALPPNTFIASMLAWLTYQWSVGNKYMYPGLKGIA